MVTKAKMNWILWLVSACVVAMLACALVSLIVPELLEPEQTNLAIVGPPPSDFPKFAGRDGREVLGEMNAKYPEYRIEIVQEADPDAIAALSKDYDESRVRMYVTRTGKVKKLYIG